MSIKKILIVDDDRLVLTGMQRDLIPEGYKVRTAESGEAALAACRDDPPDLVLLDIRMPGMSGMEVASRLRAETDIPFAFLTAYDDRELVTEAAGHGALGYLVKPVDVRQVVPLIESALARAKEIREIRRSEANLAEALSGSRAVSAAVGILMERNRLGHRAAFDLLRTRARDARCKIEQTAQSLIDAAETLSGQGPT